jgi:hypothetical protein
MLAKIIQLIVTKKHSTTLILFAFVLLFISKTYGHDKRLFMPLSAISNLKTKINFSSDSLCDLSTSNIDKKNKLFLWGWHLRKYVKFELMRSSGQITPQFAIQDKYSHKNKFVSHFITDLNTQKPKYIIEEFGAGHFFLSDTTATSLLNISDSLSLFIKKNYDICASKSNYRVYARRY